MQTTAATTILNGLTATAAGQKGKAAQAGAGGLFARLMAAIAGVMRETPASGAPGTAIVADPQAMKQALTALSAALQGVVQSAQAKLGVAEGLPEQQGQEMTAEVLTQTANDIASLLVQFDAATGGNSVAMLRAALVVQAQPIQGGGPKAETEAPDLASTQKPPATAVTAAPMPLAPTEARVALATLGTQIAGVLEDRRLPNGMPQVAQPATSSAALATATATTVPVQQAATPQSDKRRAGTDALLSRAPAGVDAPQTRADAPKPDAPPQAAQPALAQLAAPSAAPAHRDAVPQLIAEISAALDRLAPQSPPAVPEVRPAVLLQSAPPVVPPQPAAQPQQLPDLARKVQAQIRTRSFEEGTTRIELSPRGLGDLEIELSPADAGRLRVVVRADNPMVLAALRSDRDTLLGVLRDTGTQLADSSLSFEGFGTRQGSGRQSREQPAEIARHAAAAEKQASDEPQRRAPTGRIDILT